MSYPVYESKLKAPTKFTKKDSFIGGSKMTRPAKKKIAVGLSPVYYASTQRNPNQLPPKNKRIEKTPNFDLASIETLESADF